MASVTLVKFRRLLQEHGLRQALARGWQKVGEMRGARRALRSLPRLSDRGELLDFIFSERAAFFRPFQVRWEIASLLDLVAGIEPRNVLEIGTSNGGTLFLWTRVASPDATVSSIDLPGGEFGDGYPVWKIPLYKSFALPQQTIHLLRADSHSPQTLEQHRRTTGDRPLDFLFIDGDHSYDGVKQDFQLYSPLVRPGGIVAFHDVAPHADSTCQVDRFWQELKPRYKSWEFIEKPDQGWAGIGAIQMPEPSAP